MHFEPFITLTNMEVWAIIGYLIMLALDVIVGIVCSLIRRDFSSTIMREGAGHKVVCIFYIILAFVLQGLATHIQGLNIDVPAVLAVCCYFIVMEFRSITETLEKTYPELTDVFGVSGDDEE